MANIAANPTEAWPATAPTGRRLVLRHRRLPHRLGRARGTASSTTGPGACTQRFPIYSSSRGAGGPYEGGVWKCAVQSIDEALDDDVYGDWDPTPTSGPGSSRSSPREQARRRAAPGAKPGRRRPDGPATVEVYQRSARRVRRRAGAADAASRIPAGPGRPRLRARPLPATPGSRRPGGGRARRRPWSPRPGAATLGRRGGVRPRRPAGAGGALAGVWARSAFSIVPRAACPSSGRAAPGAGVGGVLDLTVVAGEARTQRPG